MSQTKDKQQSLLRLAYKKIQKWWRSLPQARQMHSEYRQCLVKMPPEEAAVFRKLDRAIRREQREAYVNIAFALCGLSLPFKSSPKLEGHDMMGANKEIPHNCAKAGLRIM